MNKKLTRQCGESEKERGKRKEKVENHTTELQEKRSPRGLSLLGRWIT